MHGKLSVKCILCLINIYVKKKPNKHPPPPRKKNDKANDELASRVLVLNQRMRY